MQIDVIVCKMDWNSLGINQSWVFWKNRFQGGLQLNNLIVTISDSNDRFP